MKKLKFCLAAAVIVQTLLSLSPAFADTYQIFRLDVDAARFVYAMNSSGDVVLTVDVDNGGDCVVGVPNCYRTYIGGVLTSAANTPPAITPDEGSPCTPDAVPGAHVIQAVCNNGFEVYTAILPGQSVASLYTGPDLSDLLSGNSGPLLYLNSEGDIVWDNLTDQSWYEAFDQTSQVPEPGSLSLLSIGVITAAGSIRRRLFR